MRTARILLPLIATAAIAGCAGPQGDGPDAGSGTTAQIMCERFVEQRLDSPAGAEFNSDDATRSGPGWLVIGTVDSDNSQGVSIRDDFACEVQMVADDEWKLRNLSGLDD